MLESLLDVVLNFSRDLIASTGYFGVFFLMALESTAFPIPSEAVMPLAGFLVEEGKFNFVFVSFAGASGSLAGALLSYFIGKFLGRKFVVKYGRYVFIHESHLAATEDFFKKKGEKAIFIARFVPVVRHLISFPAGIGEMNIKKFLIYTFAGSFIWCSILTYSGIILKENWSKILSYTRNIDYIIIPVLVVAVIWFLLRYKTKEI